MNDFYIRNSDSLLWQSGFEHHRSAIESFLNCPKTPLNTPVYISVPSSSGWGNFEGLFSYVDNSPHPNHFVYINKWGEIVNLIYCDWAYVESLNDQILADP